MDFNNPTASQEAPEKLLLANFDQYSAEVKLNIAQIEESTSHSQRPVPSLRPPSPSPRRAFSSC